MSISFFEIAMFIYIAKKFTQNMKGEFDKIYLFLEEKSICKVKGDFNRSIHLSKNI